jgi:co-chaperonin GroES (HSP10)
MTYKNGIRPIKPINDAVYIRAEKNKHGTHTFDNGKEIFIDTFFRDTATEHACHDGEVVYVPSRIPSGREMILKKGDHVYGSHFLTHEDYEDNMTGELLYRVSYESTLYCRINKDESIDMLNDWSFFEPLLEPEENMYSDVAPSLIIKSERERLPNRAVAKHLCKSLRDIGVKEGDIVVWTKDSDYEIVVEGETYFRIETVDVVAIEEKK